MKKITSILFLTITLFMMNSCDYEDQDTIKINYVAFISDFTLGVAPSGTTSQDVSIYATKTTNSDRTFTVNVIADLTTASASAYSVPSSITIPAGANEGSLSLTATGENISLSGDDVVVLEIVSNEDILIGEPITINLQQVCPYPETTLNITFDDWGSETSWNVTDDTDIILYSASPGTYTDGQVDVSTTFCLAPGTYTFTINDAFGDGLSAPADGSAVITYNETELVNISGNFGTTASQEFTINP